MEGIKWTDLITAENLSWANSGSKQERGINGGGGGWLEVERE